MICSPAYYGEIIYLYRAKCIQENLFLFKAVWHFKFKMRLKRRENEMED